MGVGERETEGELVAHEVEGRWVSWTYIHAPSFSSVH